MQMETTEKSPQYMTRTDYVIANLTGVKSPIEFRFAEKLALRRLGELEKIVKGISAKWFKSKTDLAMIDQTKEEMERIDKAISEKRAKYGVV